MNENEINTKQINEIRYYIPKKYQIKWKIIKTKANQ